MDSSAGMDVRALLSTDGSILTLPHAFTAP